MDITITRINKYSGGGTLLAFIDVCYGKLIVKGFKIINGRQGLFVSNPSEKGKDGQYHDTVSFMDASEKQHLERIAIELYQGESK